MAKKPDYKAIEKMERELEIVPPPPRLKFEWLSDTPPNYVQIISSQNGAY